METQTRTEARGAAMLSEETRKTIDHWVAKFPDDKKRSALIQSLIAAQEQNGGWISQELTEAVALAHDLGHTPFGHTGEDALNALMAPYGGFDHNAQALRIEAAAVARQVERIVQRSTSGKKRSRSTSAPGDHDGGR